MGEDGGAFRTIAAMADRCGHFCWVENRLFELTGKWATGPDWPGVRLFFSSASRQHAQLAADWFDRLPVRAGIDRTVLVVAPPGPLESTLERLEAEPELLFRLGGLVTVVLPQLLGAYDQLLAQVSPVREASVAAVLRRARLIGVAEQESGHLLLEQGLQAGAGGRNWAEFHQLLERPFGGMPGISPDARAS